MKPKLLSKCCQAPLTISTADEGTSCYVCTYCKRDTDPMFEEKPKLPEKIDMDLIRGQWQEVIMTSSPMRTVAGGDDTVKSIRLVAEKINAILDYLAKGGGEK